MYYIGSMQCDPDFLKHYGKKGMHWGDRKYQNEDGSLTPLGREHYGVGERRETRGLDIYQKQQVRRMNRQQRKLARYNDGRIKAGERDGYDVFTEEDARRNNARIDKRAAKAQAKYDQARSRLEAYNNASDVEKRKARNSIRLKRAAMIGGAALAAYGGVKLASLNSDFGKTLNYVKQRMTEHNLFTNNLVEANDKDRIKMFDWYANAGRQERGTQAAGILNPGIGESISKNIKRVSRNTGSNLMTFGNPRGMANMVGNSLNDSIRYNTERMNGIKRMAGAAGVAGIGAGVAVTAASHKNRHPGEKREYNADWRARKWKRK